jgi:hypothetical protein
MHYKRILLLKFLEMSFPTATPVSVNEDDGV